MRNLFKKEEMFIFGIMIFSGIITTILLLANNQYSLIYYGDATSRLVIARGIIDSQYPSFTNIGTVWLPLPYFLYLPFTLIDELFSSGLAGTIVNLPLLSIATIYIYKICKEITGSKPASVLASLLFGLNPNMLYLGLTGMTEATFFAFFIPSVYFFLVILKKNNLWDSKKEIMKTAFLLAGSTLCRYDAWLSAFIFILFIFIRLFFDKDNLKQKIGIFGLSLLSVTGILFWFLFHLYRFGDPFYFMNVEFYSTAWQAKNLGFRDGLYLQLDNVLKMYGFTSLMFFGPFFFILAFLGLFKKFENINLLSQILFLFIIFIQPLFTLFSMYYGMAVIKIWLNARYTILLLPMITILISLFIKKYSTTRFEQILTIIITSILIGGWYIFLLSDGDERVIAYHEAKVGFFYKMAPDATKAGEFLHNENLSGTVLLLTGAGQAQRIMIQAGYPLKKFNGAYNGDMSHLYFFPQFNFEWIVLAEEPDSDGTKWKEYWKTNISKLLNFYTPVYKNSFYTIYKRQNNLKKSTI